MPPFSGSGQSPSTGSHDIRLSKNCTGGGVGEGTGDGVTEWDGGTARFFDTSFDKSANQPSLFVVPATHSALWASSTPLQLECTTAAEISP